MRPGDKIECGACNYPVLFKKRTRRSKFYETLIQVQNGSLISFTCSDEFKRLCSSNLMGFRSCFCDLLFKCLCKSPFMSCDMIKQLICEHWLVQLWSSRHDEGEK